jgi:hypothetical protein
VSIARDTLVLVRGIYDDTTASRKLSFHYLCFYCCYFCLRTLPPTATEMCGRKHLLSCCYNLFFSVSENRDFCFLELARELISSLLFSGGDFNARRWAVSLSLNELISLETDQKKDISHFKLLRMNFRYKS